MRGAGKGCELGNGAARQRSRGAAVGFLRRAQKKPRPTSRSFRRKEVTRGCETYTLCYRREPGFFAIALEQVFSFRADWHQDDRADPLVRQYQTALDSVLESCRWALERIPLVGASKGTRGCEDPSVMVPVVSFEVKNLPFHRLRTRWALWYLLARGGPDAVGQPCG